MGHISGESPLLKPTGIQFVTKSMLGTTNGEHRKLMDVKAMSLFWVRSPVCTVGGLQVFHNMNCKLQYYVAIALAF